MKKNGEKRMRMGNGKDQFLCIYLNLLVASLLSPKSVVDYKPESREYREVVSVLGD